MWNSLIPVTVIEATNVEDFKKRVLKYFCINLALLYKFCVIVCICCKKGTSMKLQVLVKQLSNFRERPYKSKNNWQLKELISEAAKNKSYHTTNCHALAVK